MGADWYEDPTGRYEGRFFDGEIWTAQVSANGVLEIDPDWPPTPDSPFIDKETPAVAEVASGTPLRASTVTESPTRAVAILDDSVIDGSGIQRSKLLPILIGLAALAAVALVVLALTRGGDNSAELDPIDEQRVDDLERGGGQVAGEDLEDLEVDAPAGLVEPGTQFDEAEIVEVGSLRIANGASMLRDLEIWHQGYAAQRGVELAPGAGCWFGRLGDAAVQTAQCGPVGGSIDTEFLFDLVPLRFDEAGGGQVAQPVVDATTPDAVLANTLELVGAAGGTPPPVLPSRGDRAGD